MEKDLLEGTSMENVGTTSSAGIELGNLNKEQIAALVSDKELSRLSPGSAEFQAGLQKKFGSGTSETSAPPAGSESETKKTESVPEPDAGKTKVDSEERAKWSNAADRRIKELTAQTKGDREQLDAALKRIAELEGGKKSEPSARTETPTQPSVKFDEAEPVWDAGKFKDFTEFNKAWNRWDRRRERFEEQVTDSQRKAQEAERETFSKFEASGKELEKELELSPGDFGHLMSSKENFVFHAVANQEIMKSEFGARIAYEIVSDPATREKFKAMTPPQQVKFIGRLEAKFEEQGKVKGNTKTVVSGAKNPSTPLKTGTSGPAAVGSIYRPGMSFREYEQLDREQRRGR